MTCEEFEEISGAYALDAVTPAERTAAEAHLATCARCTRLLQELRGVVALLPLSVPRVNPTPALQGRILAAVRREGRPMPAVQLQGRQQAGRNRLQRWTLPGLAVAAVLMLALLGGMIAWNISLTQQVRTYQQQLAYARTHPPANVVTFRVNGIHLSATGEVLYYPKQNITVLSIEGLPQLQGAHVYQGWLLHLQGANITGTASIGLLNIVNNTATLSYPGSINGYDAAAISLEAGPEATPNAPKGNVLALATLKQSS